MGSLTSYAGEVNMLILILLIVSGVFFVLVIGPTIYFSIRYRSGKVKAPTSTNRGYWPLEISWAAVPLGVLGFIAALSTQSVLRENSPPADAMVVNVMGRRFVWQFQYPEYGFTCR